MSQSKKTRMLTRKEFLQMSAGAFTVGMFGSRALGNFLQSSPKLSLGRSGIQVSPVCYGASRVQLPALVRTVLERGVNYFDTGRDYLGGQNEVMLGEAIKSVRDQVVIQSKLNLRIRARGETLQSGGVSKRIAEQMNRSLEESLQALQTHYIDILLVHHATSPEVLFHPAVLGFFRDAKASGKIRACGFSTHNDNQDVITKATEDPFFDVIMVPYNHKGAYIHSQSGRSAQWDQPWLEKHLQQLHNSGVGTVVMKTCSAGSLTINTAGSSNYRNAIQWVTAQNFIDCAAVAMVTFEEINQNIPGAG